MTSSAFTTSTSAPPNGPNGRPAHLEAQHLLLSPAGDAADSHPNKTTSPLFSRSYSTSSSHHSLQIGSPSIPGATEQQQALRTAERRVSARLLPPLLLLVVISYLDRTALAFASIQMSHELSLSSTVYGLGSGVCNSPHPAWVSLNCGSCCGCC
jgi:hypothetical protein